MTDRAPATLSVRELEGWLGQSAERLDARAVRGCFGHGPDLGHGDAGTWISFSSVVGSGRLVRHHDGSCRLDAHRHVDGVVLLGRSHPVTTSVELWEVVDALTRPVAQH